MLSFAFHGQENCRKIWELAKGHTASQWNLLVSEPACFNYLEDILNIQYLHRALMGETCIVDRIKIALCLNRTKTIS